MEMGDVRQGAPAVVDPELELLQDGCGWVHLRADYHPVFSRVPVFGDLMMFALAR